ncbi:MAG TPA: hypothetical protein VFP85_05670, partial [Vicinamibacterales bacterium]|nr:hypothetical protein [Vicinamibacterales bacterium]
VGLGGGATPGAVARLNVDVDIVELSQAVVAGSDFFKNINFDVLTRPNAHLRVDDGRNYLFDESQEVRRGAPTSSCPVTPAPAPCTRASITSW